jgi:hypothetical protein
MGASASTENPGQCQVSYYIQYPVDRGTKINTYYINLDKRADRRAEVEHELQRMQLQPFKRFPAIIHKKGGIGCTQSHIACLKQGLSSDASHILIFEDDFYFVVDPALMHNLLQTVIQTNYDVFMLGYCVADKTKNIGNTNLVLLKKINEAICAHGYMVTRHYAPKLIQNLEEGLKLYMKLDKPSLHANDQYWKSLQTDDNWLCYAGGPCGLQRAGYSDIDLKTKTGSITDIKTWK